MILIYYLKKCRSILSILFTKIILILFIHDNFSFIFEANDLKFYK